jgi:rhodanese-related sulfurtransferase
MSSSENAISIDGLKKLMGTDQCPALVDVRRKKAFDASEKVITGAQWRDHETAADWAGEMPNGDVVVYCVHGHEVSQNAAAALRAAGKQAKFLEGGIEDFIEAGGETTAK